MNLADVIQALTKLPEELAKLSPEDLKQLAKQANSDTKNLIGVPNPGPQTLAFFSLADEVLYGGQAGGGKTYLLLLLALTAHKKSLILRRLGTVATKLVDELEAVIKNRDGWNGQTSTWKLDGRSITIGGCELEEDKQKYKGTARDFYGFDELSDFSESQYTFITTWNRSVDPKQRCRIVAASNPPTDPKGFWIMRRWAAWLDPNHHNPAQPGELRWYTTSEEGVEVEVEGRGPYTIAGFEVEATSRTYIPAKLSDNPDQDTVQYRAKLAALPPKERRAYRDGIFGAALQDEASQCIPSAWVHAAQARWVERPQIGVPMCAIGVDVSTPGGRDATVIACRHDGWFAPLVKLTGEQVLDAKDLAGKIVAMRRDGAKVIVDLGGGWGGDTLAQLAHNGIDAIGYMGIKKSNGRTSDNALKFFNVRTAAYWRFREALDPSQPGGSGIMLPPSAGLVADLCAPRYTLSSNGLVLEEKKEVKKRLGRSPDEGDAVTMAWHDGRKIAHLKHGWADSKREEHPDRAITKRDLDQERNTAEMKRNRR